MPRQDALNAREVLQDLHFPSAGIDLSAAFGAQPNRQAYESKYARTTPAGVNVRSFEPALDRNRGGSRPGLAKYLAAQVQGSTWVVQNLSVLVSTSMAQFSNSGRVVTLIAVSGGNVYYTTPGGSTWTQATVATMQAPGPPLNASGVVYSAANNQKLYFADGAHYVYFDPASNTVYEWAPSQGLLPTDNAGNPARLICTWRGRTVLSGLLNDPQNWFMSAISDPTNWNYNTVAISPSQAIAGNDAPMGLIGDVVTTLIPYTDDILIVGGDHTIYMFQGDPMSGGQINLVSDAIGMAWGTPWCKDPYGTVYFFSNRTGIYSIIPGQLPQRISQPVEQLLQDIDTGANAITMLWDDRFQGLHVFVTPIGSPSPAVHFFWEWRTGAWWTDVFGNENHNPLCCCTLDGNTPGDRVPLIGSWDGYVRTLDPDAADDDGTPIDSMVVIGPLLTPNLDDVLLKDMQAVLGESSDTITYNVFVGSTAEKALSSSPVATGTWSAGRNFNTHVRLAGHAIYVQLVGSNPWAMESIRVRIASQGKVRQRGR